MAETFGYIWETFVYFVPYLLVILVASAALALLANAGFGQENDGFSTRFRIALSYYAAFSFFGLVTAYFLSLGLTETETSFSNSILGPFATALISLLTAGLAYFSKKELTDVETSSVLVGVVCYLSTTILIYASMALAVLRSATNA